MNPTTNPWKIKFSSLSSLFCLFCPLSCLGSKLPWKPKDSCGYLGISQQHAAHKDHGLGACAVHVVGGTCGILHTLARIIAAPHTKQDTNLTCAAYKTPHNKGTKPNSCLKEHKLPAACLFFIFVWWLILFIPFLCWIPFFSFKKNLIVAASSQNDAYFHHEIVNCSNAQWD